MMRLFQENLIILILVPIFLTQAGCRTQESLRTSSVRLELLVDSSFKPREETDFTINNLTLEGNILKIEITLADRDDSSRNFSIYFNGIYQKSMPPQAILFLIPESTAETGRETSMKKIFYVDIGELKHPDHSQLVIRISGHSERVICAFR